MATGEESNKRLLDKSLIDGVKKNDLSRVEELLKLGADPNADDLLSFKALEEAIIRQNVKMVELLLRGKANPNNRGVLDVTPLHFAAERDSSEIVRLLLEYGADVNAVMIDMTPMAVALKNNKMDSVRLLERAVNKKAVPISPEAAVVSDQQKAAFEKNINLLDKIIGRDKKAEEAPLDEVTIRSAFGDTGQQLVQVFNFATRTRVAVLYNPQKQVFGQPSMTGFDDMRDKSAIESAYELYAKNGGKIDRGVIRHALDNRHKQSLIDNKTPKA